MDATAGLTQGVTEFRQHPGGGVADHPATGIPLHGPVLLMEFARRIGLVAEPIHTPRDTVKSMFTGISWGIQRGRG